MIDLTKLKKSVQAKVGNDEMSIKQLLKELKKEDDFKLVTLLHLGRIGVVLDTKNDKVRMS